MDRELIKLTKQELLEKCKELGIEKCKSKNKSTLISLINSNDLLSIEKCANTKQFTEIKNINDNTCNLTFVDLFCGIGGFHQALSNLGCKCVFACDIDESCRDTYEKNYGMKPESDITKINIDNIKSFDILCAGFPCQPFSKAGFQKGFTDDRGNLFFYICDIIKKHNPKYLLLENVRNLESHDNGHTWMTIYNNIIELGYDTYKIPLILNTLHFNIPQNRERVIILCKRKDIGTLQPKPTIPSNPKKHLTKFLKDFICYDTNKISYTLCSKLKDVETIWNKFITIMIDNNVNIPKFPIWTDWWDNIFDSNDKFYIKYKRWIDLNKNFYNVNKHILDNWLYTSRLNKNWIGAVRKFEWQAGDLNKNDSMNTILWSSRGSGIRVKRCDYIPTLVAMNMTPIYGPLGRKLSPIELLRLQSFPDNFKFNPKKIYKQLGNSVNVAMIEQCAKFLIFGTQLF